VGAAVIDGAKERELRELYGHYATENLLDRRGFTRCMRRLGLCHPLLLERFFSLFDQNDMHFLDEDTFVAALRRICDADANQKDSLVFDLMDEDSSGFLTMTEFRSFLTEFFAAASDTFVRKPGAEALGHAPTILDSLCTLIPTAAAEDFAESIESKLQAQITQYIDNVVQTAFGGIASSAYGWAGAGEEERELRMYFADFQAWSQGACAAWLSRQVQVWLDAVSLAKQVAQEEPTDLQLKELRAAVKNPKKAGALAKKAKAQVQPSRGSGAPKIPRPSCKFPREQVKMFQDLFYQISSDGIMRPDEWKRCMSRLGVVNGYTQERLFLMFDTDGDKEMNAKEFTCGLSDICLGSDAERVAFAYRFYDVTGEGMLSRNEFQLLLSKIKGQCDLSVKKASRELFKVYGIDVVQMEHTDDALERERRTAMLSTEIDEELKLYCYDVWDEFAKGKPQMDYKAFTVLAEKAPSLVDWLTELGKNIQRRFPRLLGMTFEEVVVPDSLPEEGNISLSAQKMMESFDQFAYPRRIEGGDRVLLTVRTTVKMKVDGQPDTPQPPTAHIASCFAAALPLSEFAKTGLNGQVEVSKGATRAEPFFDTTLVVELPAAALSARIDQFLEACATQLGLPALHLWINGPIGDGGPEAAIVQLRSLGAPTVLKTRFTLQLSSGVDLPAENLKVYVGDKANVVFRLQWRATDVLKKVDGTNGMRKALSNATGSDSQDLDIQVDPLDDGTCRITASMRMCEAGRHAAEEGLRSNFGRICARLGLAASPEEEIFCDYTLVLSNIRTSHFHAAAQSVFREVLGAAVGLDVSNVTIVENSWTSDTQTTVVLRLFFGKEGSSVDKLRLEMIFKLQNALVDSILTDALRKKLASSRLRIQDPVEVSHGSHADAVFSLKSDFVAVLKQDNGA
jgi:Ca2+-binding EF-hand superfamily protein